MVLFVLKLLCKVTLVQRNYKVESGKIAFDKMYAVFSTDNSKPAGNASRKLSNIHIRIDIRRTAYQSFWASP